MKKEIGVAEVREILASILIDKPFYWNYVCKMSDEQLLKTNLSFEFELDSLDFEEMFDTLDELYGISVDIYSHHPLTHYSFEDEKTVKNFIDTVNFYLEISRK